MEQENTVPTGPQSAENKGLSFRGLAEVFYKPSVFFKQLQNSQKPLDEFLISTVKSGELAGRREYS